MKSLTLKNIKSFTSSTCISRYYILFVYLSVHFATYISTYVQV